MSIFSTILGIFRREKPPVSGTNLSISAELDYLYEHDQGERTGKFAVANPIKSDTARLERVRILLAERGFPPNDPGFPELRDYQHAAMILHHGALIKNPPCKSGKAFKEEAQLCWLARDLLNLAIKKGAGDEDTKWLFAAATDRALMLEGKQQKYGTQFLEGKTFWPVDPKTTDEERQAFGIKPLRLIEHEHELAVVMQKARDLFYALAGQLVLKKAGKIADIRTMLVQNTEKIDELNKNINTVSSKFSSDFISAQKENIMQVQGFLEKVKALFLAQINSCDEMRLQILLDQEEALYSLIRKKIAQG